MNVNDITDAVRNVVKQVARPHGDVQRLSYVSQPMPEAQRPPQVVGVGPNVASIGDSLRIEYVSPEGDEVIHLANSGYDPTNPALRFMAAIGVRPSEVEDGEIDLSDDQRGLFPVVYTDDETTYPAADVLDRGEQVLYDADWTPFEEDDESEIEIEEAEE